MPDINSMISTQRIMCIKRYLDPYTAGWKFFFDSYLKKVGGKFLFHCNFNFERLSIAISDFYKECLILWSSMNKTDPSTLEEIANEVIWNNLYTKGGGIFFLTKMSTGYKNACQAFSLQQNPIKPYIFRERIKYTFTAIIKIMGYIKIVTS